MFTPLVRCIREGGKPYKWIPLKIAHVLANAATKGSSTFSVVHCGGDVEFTDGEVEHGD